MTGLRERRRRFGAVVGPFFFDKIDDSIAAAERLRNRLPESMRDKIVWFNSRMTPIFREQTLQDYKNGELYGLFCTDSFGMVRAHLQPWIIILWFLRVSMSPKFASLCSGA